MYEVWYGTYHTNHSYISPLYSRVTHCRAAAFGGKRLFFTDDPGPPWSFNNLFLAKQRLWKGPHQSLWEKKNHVWFQDGNEAIAHGVSGEKQGESGLRQATFGE